MRVAIFSDIHANLEALQAVLEDISAEGILTSHCLGDIVGYGANPSECCAAVAEVVTARVLGNHDEACLGRGNIENFNSVARMAALWTQRVMDDFSRDYLERSPMTFPLEAGELHGLLVHASPYLPEEWHYVLSENDARAGLEATAEPLVFVGHSHVPGIFVRDGERVNVLRATTVVLEPGKSHLINVGSVGQPRDGDPRAAWCLLDPERRTAEIRRVPYDLATAQQKIRDAKLPEILASRLAWGE